MKKRILLVSKVIGIIAFYSLVLALSIFFTMSILIKGEEIKAPDLLGKNLDEVYEIAARNGFFIKKVTGNYSRNYKPLTVIEQVPEPGVRIKLKSNVKIFITSELVEVIVPEITGYGFEESAKLIKESELKKRYVSYISSDSIPADFVISQSLEAGSRVPLNSSIDILISKGKKEQSYIMPDIIGKDAEKIVIFFEKIGLKIDKITEVSYPGLEYGVIIWQHPSPGHKVGPINRISIQVSE